MKILGMSASVRPWGNTDLLVQHALQGARDGGAECRFVRLTDYELRPCTGCMACVFKGRDCHLEDGLPAVLEELRGTDALVLGSPTYVLGATGPLKTLQDRLIRFGVEREFVGRLSVALAVAGVPGWEPYALQQVSLTLLFLGMPIVDQFTGYGQGPGEVLDDTAACERAREAGAALASGDHTYRGSPGTCPACHLDQVVRTADGGGSCLMCDLPGHWEMHGEAARFVPAEGAKSRFSEEKIYEHFHDRVLPSGPRFREQMRDYRERVKEFREGIGQ